MLRIFSDENTGRTVSGHDEEDAVVMTSFGGLTVNWPPSMPMKK